MYYFDYVLRRSLKWLTFVLMLPELIFRLIYLLQIHWTIQISVCLQLIIQEMAQLIDMLVIVDLSMRNVFGIQQR